MHGLRGTPIYYKELPQLRMILHSFLVCFASDLMMLRDPHPSGKANYTIKKLKLELHIRLVLGAISTYDLFKPNSIFAAFHFPLWCHIHLGCITSFPCNCVPVSSIVKIYYMIRSAYADTLEVEEAGREDIVLHVQPMISIQMFDLW